MSDRVGIERFVRAQDPVADRVREELRRGRKESHWMWFVFPQLRGFGHSETARYYGIVSAQEAREYWGHAVLRGRLRECVGLVLAIEGKSAHEIFGSPDDLKLRSCLTLFAYVAPDEPQFEKALVKYFGGQRDPRTLAML